MCSKLFNYISLIFSLLLFVVACRENDNMQSIVTSTQTQVTEGDASSELRGFYLLNEGNMGHNKASLDYFDYASGQYNKNIFAERNPLVVWELGDVGNDLQIYDGRLYAVINCSNLVEVMDASTAVHIGSVTIPSCRYIAFEGDYAYVTSWAGELQANMSRKGYVAKVDLSTLEVVAECAVGFDPEELAIYGGRLYVANSGGNNFSGYDDTITVIDLETFEVVDIYTVEINLHRLRITENGVLFVSSRGNYNAVGSKLIALNALTGARIKEFELSVTNIALLEDKLYVIYAPLSTSVEDQSTKYVVIDTNELEVCQTSFITDGTEVDISVPYGVAVNKRSGEIFVTDAMNFLTPGKLHCYSADGVRKWSVTTGDIPAHFAFLE